MSLVRQVLSFTHYLSFVLWVVVLVAGSALQQANAGLKGDRELLRQAAMEHRENRERIETWQGKATIKNQRIDEYQTVQLTSEVKFYWVSQGSKLRWDWSAERHQDDSMVVKTRNVPADAYDSYGPLIATGIAANGRLHLYSNITSAGSSLIEKRPQLRTKRLENDLVKNRNSIGFFSPMWHVTRCGGGDVEQKLLGYFKYADDRRIHAVVSRNDDILTLSVKMYRSEVRSEYEFNLQQQGNVVKNELNDSSGFDRCDYTWEQVGRIWLPRTLHREFRKDEGPSAPLTLIEDIEWTENLVNEPIDVGLFDVASIELLPDTRRINEITRQSDPPTPPPWAPGSMIETQGTNTHPLLIAWFLMVLLILGIVVWRRYSNHQGRSGGTAHSASA